MGILTNTKKEPSMPNSSTKKAKAHYHEFNVSDKEGGRAKVRICELPKEPGNVMVNIKFQKLGKQSHRKFMGTTVEEVLSWALNTLPIPICKKTLTKYKFSTIRLTDVDTFC